MKCPNCDTLMEIQEAAFFTSVGNPKENWFCGFCDRVLLVFEVTGGDNFFVSLDERPEGQSFADFIEEKLAAKPEAKLIDGKNCKEWFQMGKKYTRVHASKLALEALQKANTLAPQSRGILSKMVSAARLLPHDPRCQKIVRDYEEKHKTAK